MDFLNKTFAQLSDLFRTMTLGARITSGLLLAVVVVGLVYLFRWQGSGPEVDLMHGLSVPPAQLMAMQEAFGKAGLGDHEVRGTQIFVPRGQRAKYLAALADAKLVPPSFGSQLRDALNSGNVFDSAEQKKQRLKAAIQDELSLIISSMPGVESAYVLYDSDVKSGFSREKLVTASVSVKPIGSTQLDEDRVGSIRHLVAAAIAGLKPENVTVADLNGRFYHSSPDGGGSADDNLYLALKRKYEERLKQQICGALRYIPNVTVEASAVLDRERISRSKKVQLDPKPFALRDSTHSTSRTQEGGGPAGRPGFQAQQPNSPSTLAKGSSGSHQSEEEERRDVINKPSGEEIEKELVGLTPKRVTVSVGIPSSYFASVWQERNPPKEGEEPKKPDQAALDAVRQEESSKIQKHVAALLPPVENLTDLSELVTVTMFQDIQQAKPPEPAVAARALSWFGQYWGTLGVMALALLSLLMLRSMVRAAPASAAPAAGMPTVYSETASAPEPAAPAEPAKRLRRFQGGGRSLRDDLSEMVKEDPDTAANILKSWIGHGA